MRITFNSQYRDSSAAIDQAAESLIDLQRQVATGKRVGKASDDPTAAANAINERAQLASVEQYARAADSATSRLTVVDSVLSDLVEKLTAAQSSTMSARGSTKTPAQREAVAKALEAIRADVLDDFNTSFRGAYVFAGAASTTRPFTEAGDGSINAYAGSSTEVSADVGSQDVPMSLDGDAIAQGGDTEHIFDAFDDLIAAVRAGDDAGMQTGMDALSRAFDRTTTAQSRVGVALQALETEQVRLQEVKLAGTTRLSKLEDADMAEVIAGMNRADAAYKAALGAAATAAKVSLLDYLG
jgi:flagellar hook-associated protein 3 FlgL